MAVDGAFLDKTTGFVGHLEASPVTRSSVGRVAGEPEAAEERSAGQRPPGPGLVPPWDTAVRECGEEVAGALLFLIRGCSGRDASFRNSLTMVQVWWMRKE